MQKATDGILDLDGKAISHRGMMLLAYQRTKQVSRKAVAEWEAGRPETLDAEIRARRDAVFQGTVAEIREEYLPVRDAIREKLGRLGTVIDIGCGQAINSAFLHRDFNCDLILVDIEDTPEQYHFWRDEGAGYASLTDTAAFLRDNGIPADRFRTINPRKTPDALADISGDLVISTFSCAFHYPVGDYVDLMLRTIAAGGAVILDIRNRYRRKPDAALKALMAGTAMTDLLVYPKSTRVMFTA